MRSITTILFLLCLVKSSFAQICESDRYKKAVFPGANVTSDLVYSVADTYDPFNLDIPIEQKLDVYEPIGDTQAKRPVVFMMFGGAYVIGDKEHADMVAWCDSLASYGYVAVSVDYRLGVNPVSEGSAIRAIYRGVQDMRAAIRYMLEFQDVFRIDPEYIYLGGESAGAFNALHTAFYTEESDRPAETYGIPLENTDLGCLDCSGNNYSHSFEIAGIIDLWGAILDPAKIDADEQIPTLIIHGDDDLLVPYDQGDAFTGDLDLVFPYVYGAVPIKNRLDYLSIDNDYHPYPGEGHLFYGLPDGIITFPNDKWEPVWNQGHEFLYSTLEFTSEEPVGEVEACMGQTHIYNVANNTDSEYCWNITGGTIINDNGYNVEVNWNNGGGTLSVIERNCLDVIGFESATLNVTTKPLPIAGISTTPINDDTYYFVDSSIDGVTYTLDLGDGSPVQTMSAGQAITHTFAASGTYTITQAVTNDCGTDISTITLNVVLSSLEEELFLGLEIYPTLVPQGENIQITFASNLSYLDIEIISLDGRILSSQILTGNGRVDTSNLPNGMYIIKVSSEGRITTRKIVID